MRPIQFCPRLSLTIVGVPILLANFLCGSQSCFAQEAPEWAARWPYLIIGEVLDVKSSPAGNFNENYSYRVRVLCEHRKRIEAGAVVTVNGPRQMVRNHLIRIPAMAKGTHFIMPLSQTDEKEVFQYTLPLSPTENWTPFGVPLPAPVKDSELNDLKVALLKYGETIEMSAKLTPVEIADLRRNTNYFLWALGTSALAKDATSDIAETLLSELQTAAASEPHIGPDVQNAVGIPDGRHVRSPRQAIWIVHCLENVVPPAARISGDRVVIAIVAYWQQWLGMNQSDSFIP